MHIAIRLFVLLVALGAGLFAAVDTWQGGTGNWSTGSNWSTGQPPLSSEIAALGSSTVTIDSATATAASISGTANILLPAGGTLTVNGTIVATNIAMNGGTLANASCQCTVTASTSQGTLSNVTIANGSMLDLTQVWGASVFASNGLTINGSVHIGNAAATTYGVLYWSGTMSIGGAGDILLGSSTNNGLGESGSAGTLTLLYPLMVHGTSGYLNSNSGTLLNQSSILADVAGGNITINTQTLTNQGTIASLAGGSLLTINATGWSNSGTFQAAAGSQLAMHGSGAGSNMGTMTASNAALTVSGGTWSTAGGSSLTLNSGTLTLGGAWSAPAGAIISTGASTINLGGTFSTTQANLISYAAGTTTVNITGIMDNSAGLNLDAATGPWFLMGGTINGGTITGSGADTLIGTTVGGTLSAVTLAATTVVDLTQAWGVQATITNNLTNNGSIKLGNVAGSTYGVLYWSGNQTWNGSGDILAGNSGNNRIAESDSLKTLTIASPLKIHGQALTIYLSSNSTLSNASTIDCDVAGGTFSLNGGFTLANSGIIEATAVVSGSSTLTMDNIGSWTNSGTFLADANDTFSLVANAGSTGANTGTITDAGGAMTISGGTWTTVTVGALSVASGTLTLGGTWTFPVQGDITLTGTSILYLGGTFSTPQAGLITYAPATTTVYVTGAMDNSANLVLDAATGPWFLDGGTITGGSITGAGADTLVATTLGGTLAGVAIPSGTTLDISQAWGANLTITTSLALDGTILLGNPSASTYGILYWSGTQAWSGGGSILAGGSSNNRISENGSSLMLTIGPSLTIHGQDIVIYLESGSTLLNQGIIDCDISGGTFTFNGNFTLHNTGTIEATATAPGYSTITMNTIGSWINSGAMSASSGDTLSLLATATSTGSNLGTIRSTGGNLTISGGSWSTTGVGNISVGNGSLTLGGAWTFTTQGDITTTGSTTLSLGGTYSIGQAGLISYAAGSIIKVTGALDITAGLTLSSATGPWYLDGGTISGGIITGSGGNTLIATTAGGTLSNVTIAAGTTFDLSQVWGATATITNNLVIDGTILLGNAAGSTYGSLSWSGIQTWSGGGSILAGSSGNNRISGNVGNQTLTIGTTLTIHGQTMVINLPSNSTLDNQGVIDSDVATGIFTLNGNFTLANSGTIEATAGGAGSTVTMYDIGSWTNSGLFFAGAGDALSVYQVASTIGSNTGTITGTGGAITIGSNNANVGSWSTVGVGKLSVSNGTLTLGGSWSSPASGDIATTGTSNLYLGGTFTTAQAGLVSYPAASTTVYLSGVLTNTAAVLTLSSATGPWYLLGGTVVGGTITDSGADTLIATTTTGTLSGVTVSSGSIIDISQAWGATITITNGLTNNGSILLGNASASTYGSLQWSGGPQSWSGTGDILAGASANNRITETDSGQSLTLVSPLRVHGKALSCYAPGGSSLINQSIIDCDVAGGGFNLYGGFALSNAGTIENTALGGTMSFTVSTFTNAGTVTIGQTGAQAWTCTGNFTQTAAGTLNLMFGGTTSGLYDTMAVSGTAAVAGHVAISTFGGYFAHAPDAVNVMTAGAMSGAPTSSNAAFSVTTTATTLVAAALDGMTPTVVVTPPGATTSLNPIPFTLTFSEPVTTPVSAGFTVANGNATVAVSGGPVTFTAMVTPTTSNGTVSLTVKAGAVTNSGTVGNALSNTANVTYKVAPTLTIAPVSGTVLTSQPIDFVVTASTAVTALTSGGLAVSGGTIGTITGGGTSYTVPVTVSAPGSVQFQVLAGAVADISGGGTNLASAVILVSYAPGGNTVWTGGGADSLWNTSGNWSNGVPVDGSGVVIPPGANVTLTQATAKLSTLNLQGSLTINSGGTLLMGTAPNTVTLNGGTLTMNGGTLTTAVVSNGTGGSFLATNSNSTVSGISIGTGVTFDLSQVNAASCTVSGGLTVDGTVQIGAPGTATYGTLTWSGSQTWGGSGNIVLGGNGSNEIVDVNSGYVLTILGPLTIHGAAGTVFAYYGGTILNYGTITADANGSLRLYAFDWTNEAGATLSAGTGATLTIYTETGGTGSNGGAITSSGGTVTFTGTGTAQWSNSGTITGSSAVFNVGTSTSTTTLLTFPGQTLGGNTINISGGTITGSGITTVTPAHGPWYLAGGTIKDATISGSGAMLIATAAAGSLDNVIIDTPTVFDMSQVNNSQCTTLTGLTVNGTVLVGAPGAGNYGTLTWSGSQSWGGSGSIVLGGSGNNEIVDVNSGFTLTILSPLSIHGAAGNIYAYYGGTILNYGTITADANGSLRIYALDWTNELGGTLSCANGATVTIYTETGGTGLNAGTINATGGTVTFTGGTTAQWSNSGTITGSGAVFNVGTSTTSTTLLAFPGQQPGGNAINITAGTITGSGITTISSAHGPWYLAGGTIRNATISGTGAMLIATASAGTLDNVTIDTPTVFDMSQSNNSQCTTINGLTVNGTILVGAAGGATYGTLTWSGTQAWGGSGSIVMGGNASNEIVDVSSGYTLTIQNPLAIHGTGGNIYGYYSGTILNHGTITVDAYGSLRLYALDWTNEADGVLSAATGATLTIFTEPSGTGSNLGHITSAGSTIDFTGTGTWTNGGTITGSTTAYNIGSQITATTLLTLPGQSGGNAISINAGTVTNAGTITITAAHGPWYLDGGTISGGTISGSGSMLIATGSGGTLDNVIIDTPTVFDLSQVNNANCTITNGLTVNGTVLLGSSSGSTYGRITWSGSQTWGGSGNIVYGGSASNQIIDSTTAALTISHGLTIHGLAGILYAYYSSTLNNYGTIAVDAGGSFTINANSWVNEASPLGLISAANGSALIITSGVSGSNLGSITANNCTISWNGAGTLVNSGSISGPNSTFNVGVSTTSTTLQTFPGQASGDTINLTGGTLANAGTSTLTATNGPWHLSGTTIVGGTIAGTINAGGPVLIATPGGGSLSNVTIASGATFDMGQYGNTACTTLLGLTVDGTILVGSTLTSNYGVISWSGSQTWSGSGTILFGGSTNNRINDTIGGTTLTIASALTLHGRNALIRANQGGSSILNQGTIANDVPGGQFAVIAGTFTNAGTLSLGLTSAQTMTCSGNFVQTAAGALNLVVGGLNNCSTLAVSSGSATLDGTVNLAVLNGYYVHQGDAFTVASATSVSGTFAAKSGPFVLSYTATSAIATAADATVPTVVVTTPAGITNASPIPFTLTFSEPVSAPSIVSGFTVSGGSVTRITGGPVVYTASVTPAQLGTAGTISLDVNAGAAQNSGAVSNAQSSTVNVTYDPVAPTVSFLPQSGGYANASPFTLTLTFSKPVTAPTLPAIQVTNGSAAALAIVSSTVSTVQITPAAEGAVTIQLNAGAVFDSASNGNALAMDTLTFDSTPPRVSSITPNGSTVSGPFTFQVTFSEPVQQFTAENFTLTGATLGSITGSGASWSVPVVPTASPVTLNVSSALDLAGNALVVDGNASAAVTYSVGALTVTSITPNGGHTNAPISFQVTFSGAVTSLTAGNLTLTGGSIGTISGSGTSWTVPVTAPSQGTVSLTVNSVIGATLASPASAATVYDTIAPTILSVTPPNGGTSNNQNLSFVVTFSEAVNPPLSNSFAVTGGSAGAFSGSGAVWTIPVSAPSQGPVSLQILAATDLAGNPLAGTPTYAITYDTSAPSVLSILPANGTITNAPISFVVTFSEAVAAPVGGNIALSGGTIGTVVVNGATWTIPVTAPSQGAVSLTITTSVTDLAGNPLASAATSAVTYDTAPPTVSSITPNGGASNSASPAFTVTFSENVNALTAGNIMMTGGVPGTITGSGAVWTVPVTSPVQGPVSISVNGATDLAGNTQTVAGAASFTYDTVNPTAAITPNGGAVSGPFSFVVTFSEAVAAPTAQNYAVSGGNAGTLVVNGLTWTIPVTPTVQGPVTVNLTGVADLAGNLLFGNGLATSSVTFNTTGPTVTAITPNGGYSNSGALAFTVTFSEAVNAPLPANLQLSGGTLGAISGSGATWTVPVTQPVEGTITLTVLSATDSASNPLTVTAADTASLTYDITPPSILSIAPGSGVTGSNPISFLVTFSEPVSPPTAGNLAASSGTVGTVVVNGSTWTVPVANPAQGAVSLTVSGVSDLAGNPLVALMTATVTYDIPPTIVSITPNGGTTATSPITFTITTSKALSDLAGMVANGTVQQTSGGGTSWTITAVPTINGLVTLTIPAGGAVDLAGLSNAAPATASVTFGSAAPTVVLTTAATTTNSAPLIFTATFSAPVSAPSAAGVTVSNGTLGAISGGPSVYTLPVNPAGNGPVTVQVQAGAVTDATSTPNLASAVVSEIYDTIPPTAALSIAAPQPLTLASTTLVIAFSEPVTGFTGTTLAATNATISGFTALTASTYSATLTPTAVASIQITIPAGAASDLAGNLSLPAARIISLQTAVASTTVVSPAVATSAAGNTVYGALCPGTWSGLAQVQSFLSGKTDAQARGFVWDAVVQDFVQVPASAPSGGWQPDQGVFLATRQPVAFDFNGSMSTLDYELVLKPGWNFVGLPPLDDNGTELVSHTWVDLRLEDISGNLISGTPRSGLIDVGPWLWDGASYTQVAVMQTGTGYWIENASSPGVDLVLRRLNSAEIAGSQAILAGLHGAGTASTANAIGYHAHSTPPMPPGLGSAQHDSATHGCGLGSGLGALLGSLAFLLLRLRSRRPGSGEAPSRS